MTGTLLPPKLGNALHTTEATAGRLGLTSIHDVLEPFTIIFYRYTIKVLEVLWSPCGCRPPPPCPASFCLEHDRQRSGPHRLKIAKVSPIRSVYPNTCRWPARLKVDAGARLLRLFVLLLSETQAPPAARCRLHGHSACKNLLVKVQGQHEMRHASQVVVQ